MTNNSGTGDKNIVDGGTIYAIFAKHDHNWVTEIIGENTLSNYCTVVGCDRSQEAWATLTVTTPKAYTGAAYNGAKKTGDLAATLTYFKGEAQLEGAPTAVGDDYKVVMSYNDKAVTNGFAIAPATIDSISFNPASQNYDGTAKSVTMTVKAGGLTLDEGDYDITDGVLSGVVGVPSQDTVTTVTVEGKGNFQGTLSQSWKIVAPSGSFDAKALSGLGGCTVDGNTATVTDSKSLEYDKNGTWFAGFTISFPNTQTKSSSYVKGATYVDAAHAYIVTPSEVTYNGTQLINNEADGFTADQTTVNYDYASSKKNRSYTYFSTVTYRAALTPEIIEQAKAQGDVLTYKVTAYGLAWTDSAQADGTFAGVLVA